MAYTYLPLNSLKNAQIAQLLQPVLEILQCAGVAGAQFLLEIGNWYGAQ